MLGLNIGLVTLLKQDIDKIDPNNKFCNYHCIIHQEFLCAKSTNIKNVMDVVIKCVKKIKTSPISHRTFQNLLKETNSQYGDLIFWSNIRWLSRGKVLKPFFDLRCEV